MTLGRPSSRAWSASSTAAWIACADSGAGRIPFHLFRYLDEQVFRYNNRKMNEGDRFNESLSAADVGSNDRQGADKR